MRSLPPGHIAPLIRALFRTLMTWLLGISPCMAEERIPVMAWSGPPANETTQERYRELADAGFTHNFSGFGNAEAMGKALDVAHAAGIKQFVSIPELEKEPEVMAARFKNHPALAGYYLRDEPSAADFPKLAAWTKRIQSVDAEHPCYINLFPNYANAQQLGTANYQEHLDRFVKEVPVPWISFDHYPVVGNSLRGEWYDNLEMVRATAKREKKPFWAFALAVAHDPYPIATLGHLRLQVFSNLAYGAHGIQYFTYWTHKSPHWNFHEAPIDVDGKRTPVYDRVKQVNAEIRALSPVFVGAEVLRVGHTEPVPAGAKAYESEAPVTSCETGNVGALLSVISKGKQRFLVIVNRDLQKALPLNLTFAPSPEIAEYRKDGSKVPVQGGKFNASITPGDLRVLTWVAQP